MERGSLGAKYQDRTNPVDKHVEVMLELREVTMAPFTPQMFGNAGREHMEKYGGCSKRLLWRQTTAPHLTHTHTPGTTAKQIAKIAYKNHKHSVNNPYSQVTTGCPLQYSWQYTLTHALCLCFSVPRRVHAGPGYVLQACL